MKAKLKSLTSYFKSLYKTFRFKQKSRKYDAVFFCTSYVDELWIRSTLIECLKNDLQLALVVISNDKLLLKNLREIYGSNLDILVIERAVGLKSLKSKLLISASSGLSKKHFNKESTLIHMPHSLASLHTVYPKDAFTEYDYLFATGPYQAAEFKKLNSNNSFGIGYGKFDLIKPDISNNNSRIRTILLAPSWHEGNFFDLVGNELVEELLKSGYAVILRPHPSHFITPNHDIDKCANIHQDNNNFILEDSTQGFDSFYESDLLISDFSGVAFEFAYSRLLPIIFIESKYKVLNQSWQNLGLDAFEVSERKNVGIISEPNVTNIKDALTDVSDSEKWTKSILDSRSKNIYNFQECASNACETIKSLLK